MQSNADGAEDRGERNPAQSIRLIMDAARAEFLDYGFDAAKMDRIARRAGVSRSTVYYYFPEKEEIYWQCLKDITLTTLDRLIAIDFHSMSPVEALRGYAEAFYDALETDLLVRKFALDQVANKGAQFRSTSQILQKQESLTAKLAEVLKRGRDSGIFNNDLTVAQLEYMTFSILIGCHSASFSWRPRPAEVIQNVIQNKRELIISAILGLAVRVSAGTERQGGLAGC